MSREIRWNRCTLRKVVETTKHPTMYWRKVEHLECGHTMLQPVDLYDRPRPGVRRRCRKCGRIEKQIIVKTKTKIVRIRSKPRHHRVRRESDIDLIRKMIEESGHVRLRIVFQIGSKGKYYGLRQTALVVAVKTADKLFKIVRRIEQLLATWNGRPVSAVAEEDPQHVAPLPSS